MVYGELLDMMNQKNHKTNDSMDAKIARPISPTHKVSNLKIPKVGYFEAN